MKNSENKKIVILCHGAFNYVKNKTGNMLIRYRESDVVAVIDHEKSGTFAIDEIGYGKSIPVVSSFKECLKYSPDTLVIGSASQGGFISKENRKDVLSAIRNGCNIISGMHEFINNDKEFSNEAKISNVNLKDLRMPPDPPHFPIGSWKERKTPVLLIVGTDCDSGKMTTAWEVAERLKKRGRAVEFVGTGQTGILLSGSGVPIDAVKADFMAGEIEKAIDDAIIRNPELIIVEGQGSLTNQYYAGVTLGLLHGAMPDYMLMTHDPARPLDVTNYPMSTMETIIKLHLDLMSHFKDSKFIGINLLTFALSEERALETINQTKDKFNLPTTDLIRFGDMNLIDAIEEIIQ